MIRLEPVHLVALANSPEKMIAAKFAIQSRIFHGSYQTKSE